MRRHPARRCGRARGVTRPASKPLREKIDATRETALVVSRSAGAATRRRRRRGDGPSAAVERSVEGDSAWRCHGIPADGRSRRRAEAEPGTRRSQRGRACAGTRGIAAGAVAGGEPVGGDIGGDLLSDLGDVVVERGGRGGPPALIHALCVRVGSARRGGASGGELRLCSKVAAGEAAQSAGRVSPVGRWAEAGW